MRTKKVLKNLVSYSIFAASPSNKIYFLFIILYKEIRGTFFLHLPIDLSLRTRNGNSNDSPACIKILLISQPLLIAILLNCKLNYGITTSS